MSPVHRKIMLKELMLQWRRLGFRTLQDVPESTLKDTFIGEKDG